MEGVGNHKAWVQTHPDKAKNLSYTTQKTGQTPAVASLASRLFCTGTVLFTKISSQIPLATNLCNLRGPQQQTRSNSFPREQPLPTCLSLLVDWMPESYHPEKISPGSTHWLNLPKTPLSLCNMFMHWNKQSLKGALLRYQSIPFL